MEGFWRYEFGGLIFEGAYFWNFTVAPQSYEILHICMVGGVQPCPPPPSIQTSPDYVKFHYFVGLYLP